MDQHMAPYRLAGNAVKAMPGTALQALANVPTALSGLGNTMARGLVNIGDAVGLVPDKLATELRAAGDVQRAMIQANRPMVGGTPGRNAAGTLIAELGVNAAPFIASGGALSPLAGIGASAALTGVQSMAGRDASTAGLLADMTDDEGVTRHFETIANNPAARVAFDVGTDAIGNAIGAALQARNARRAAAAARAAEEAEAAAARAAEESFRPPTGPNPMAQLLSGEPQAIPPSRQLRAQVESAPQQGPAMAQGFNPDIPPQQSSGIPQPMTEAEHRTQVQARLDAAFQQGQEARQWAAQRGERLIEPAEGVIVPRSVQRERARLQQMQEAAAEMERLQEARRMREEGAAASNRAMPRENTDASASLAGIFGARQNTPPKSPLVDRFGNRAGRATFSGVSSMAGAGAGGLIGYAKGGDDERSRTLAGIGGAIAGAGLGAVIPSALMRALDAIPVPVRNAGSDAVRDALNAAETAKAQAPDPFMKWLLEDPISVDPRTQEVIHYGGNEGIPRMHGPVEADLINEPLPSVTRRANAVAPTQSRPTQLPPSNESRLKNRRGSFGWWNEENAGGTGSAERERDSYTGYPHNEPTGSFPETLNSRLEFALQSAPFDRGTPKQWLAVISKNVPQWERDWTGVDRWLSNLPPDPIEKRDVLKFWSKNRVQLATAYHDTYRTWRPQSAEFAVDPAVQALLSDLLDRGRIPDDVADILNDEWGYDNLHDYDLLVEQLKNTVEQALPEGGGEGAEAAVNELRRIANDTKESLEARRHAATTLNHIDSLRDAKAARANAYGAMQRNYDELVERLQAEVDALFPEDSGLDVSDVQRMADNPLESEQFRAHAQMVLDKLDSLRKAELARDYAYRAMQGDVDSGTIEDELNALLKAKKKKKDIGTEYFEAVTYLPTSYTNRKLGKHVAYQSSHWDEPNVAVHLRGHVTEVYDPVTGTTEPALYVGEWQSDWAQGANGAFRRTELDPWDNDPGSLLAHGDNLPLPESIYAKGDARAVEVADLKMRSNRLHRTIDDLNEIDREARKNRWVQKQAEQLRRLGLGLPGDAFSFGNVPEHTMLEPWPLDPPEADVHAIFDHQEKVGAAARELEKIRNKLREINGELPHPTPFAKTQDWTELGLKSSLYEAAKRGIRKVVLPTGRQAAVGAGNDPEMFANALQAAREWASVDTRQIAWRANKDGSIDILPLNQHTDIKPVRANDIDDVAEIVTVENDKIDVRAFIADAIGKGKTAGALPELKKPSTGYDMYTVFDRSAVQEVSGSENPTAGLVKFYEGIVPKIVRDYLATRGLSFDKVPAELVPRLEYGPNSLTITMPAQFMKDILNPKIGQRLGFGTMDALGTVAGVGAGGLMGYREGDTENERIQHAFEGAALGGLGGFGVARGIQHGLPKALDAIADAMKPGASKAAVAAKGTAEAASAAGRRPSAYAQSIADGTIGTPKVGEEVLTPGTKRGMSPRVGKLAEGVAAATGRQRMAIPDEVMQKLARLVDVSEIDQTKAATMSNDELMAVGNRVAALSDELERLARDMGSATPETIDDLTAKFDAALSEQMRLADTFSLAKSERGRGLRIVSKVGAGSLAGALGVARRVLGVKSLSPELVGELRRVVLDRSLTSAAQREAAYAKVINKAMKLPWYKVVFGDYRRVNMLTAPATWTQNLLGNTTELASRWLATPTAAALDAAMSWIQNKPRSVTTSGRAAGYRTGFARGTGEMMDRVKALAHNEHPQVLDMTEDGYGALKFNQADFVRDLPRLPEAVTKRMQKVADIVYTAMDAADRPFYQGALDAAFNERAHLNAMNAGLKRGTAEYDQFVSKLLTKGPDGMYPFMDQADHIVAQFEALDDTFKTDSAISRAMRRMDPVAQTIVGWFVPFVKTPANLVRKSLEATPGPVGLITSEIHLRGLKKQLAEAGIPVERIQAEMRRARIMNAGKQLSVGAGLIAAGYMLTEAGVLTGDYVPVSARDDEDTEDAKRDALMNQPPLSIKIGDTAHSLSAFAQFAPLLALGHALAQTVREERAKGLSVLGAVAAQPGKVAKRAFGSTVRTMAEFPLLQGVKQVGDLLGGQNGFDLGKYAGQQASSMIPLASGVASLARVTDPIGKRKVEGFTDALQERIPFARWNVPAQVGPLGEVTPRANPFAALLSPTRPQVMNTDPLHQALDQIGFYPTAAQKLRQDSPESYGRLAERFGAENVRPMLNEDESYADYSVRRQQEGAAEQSLLDAVLAGDPAGWRYVGDGARKEFQETGDWRVPLRAALSAQRRAVTTERNLRRPTPIP